MPTTGQLPNYIEGRWCPSATGEYMGVTNPATHELLAHVPMSGEVDVATAVAAASAVLPEWRRTPPVERVQYLFKLKRLLEEHLEDLARLITLENGKTLTESRAEMRRAIENVEVACGIPTLMQGYSLEDVAVGIDEIVFRRPVGVVAAITPFNFPAMIPFWFLPYAIACGNSFILKPSERVPLTMQRTFELVEQLDLPRGVISLVNGGRAAVDSLLDHPDVQAISFVGSSPTAKYIYTRASSQRKRVQCQGGAKNYAVVLPDADMNLTTQIMIDSAFGCAGQRCLAVSVAVTVGEARHTFKKAIAEMADSLKVGFGLEESVQMGPVITPESKARVQGLIARGENEGATVVVDGRRTRISSFGKGNFLSPTVLDNVLPQSEIAQTEIFGPVLGLSHAETVDEAIEILSCSHYGNAASIFTTNGAAARKFRYEAPAGNIGINIGVAAPMAFFPFGGIKDSFMGTLHGQGRDAIEFFTDKRTVIERWPKEWSRVF